MLARIRKSLEEREEGFTLIELLVVMIIIGILAAIAIPVFLNQRDKGYDASAKADVAARQGYGAYYVDGTSDPGHRRTQWQLPATASRLWTPATRAPATASSAVTPTQAPPTWWRPSPARPVGYDSHRWRLRHDRCRGQRYLPVI